MKDIIIDLDPCEVLIAETVGTYLQNKGQRQGFNDKHGYQPTPAQSLYTHILSAKAELALAKHLGVYWGGSSTSFKEERDVGNLFEVRAVDDYDRRLILHDVDPEAYYVLVLVQGSKCSIRGYIDSASGKNPLYWDDPTKAGRPAYFVWINHLLDAQDLKEILKENKC